MYVFNKIYNCQSGSNVLQLAGQHFQPKFALQHWYLIRLSGQICGFSVALLFLPSVKPSYSSAVRHTERYLLSGYNYGVIFVSPV